MVAIREQKLIYHLTSVMNLSSILKNGLQPRSILTSFHDIADVEILAGRADHGLDRHVPFHWFSRNPFDGRVQRDRPGEPFVLITVHRSIAKALNWKVLPRHPLAKKNLVIYDYQKGFDRIDWALMETRDYHNPECKSVCMAECLSPGAVNTSNFFRIYAPTEQIKREATKEIDRHRLKLDVTVNRGMFC